jgi:CRISPR system Cascade subunit CasD
MSTNTLFLRFEGPLQAWGDHQTKFVIRRTAEAPTKSGVIGMLCAALGVSRTEAPKEWFPKLAGLNMGVRIDQPGFRWWDYHTVGAGMQMRIAKGGGKTRPGAMLTRREYLCDASFLVALQGAPALIAELEAAMKAPQWTLYLGRKCCPPSRPLLLAERPTGDFPDLISALKAVPWRPRLEGDRPPQTVAFLLDWQPTPGQPKAPEDALIWYDVPVTFDPPSHSPRFVIRRESRVGKDGEVLSADEPAQSIPLAPPRPRANYTNTEYKERRKERLDLDHHLCVFCKAPATTVQHVTYRRAGGNEIPEDLRALCRYCHDAVTMIEYGLGMGLDRINPEEPRWRNMIIQKREEIIRFRSLETRRRKLAAEEV